MNTFFFYSNESWKIWCTTPRVAQSWNHIMFYFIYSETENAFINVHINFLYEHSQKISKFAKTFLNIGDSEILKQKTMIFWIQTFHLLNLDIFFKNCVLICYGIRISLIFSFRVYTAQKKGEIEKLIAVLQFWPWSL